MSPARLTARARTLVAVSPLLIPAQVSPSSVNRKTPPPCVLQTHGQSSFSPMRCCRRPAVHSCAAKNFGQWLEVHALLSAIADACGRFALRQATGCAGRSSYAKASRIVPGTKTERLNRKRRLKKCVGMMKLYFHCAYPSSKVEAQKQINSFPCSAVKRLGANFHRQVCANNGL